MIYDAYVYYSHELISLGSSIVEVMEKEGLICWDSKRDSMGFSDIADALSSSKAYVLIGPDPYGSTYRYTLLREMQKYRTTQSFFVINDVNTVNLIKGSCNDVYAFNVLDSSESIYRNWELMRFLSVLKNTVENVIIKEPMKVFISHSHKDKERAEELWKELTAHGIKCWIDTKDIPPGHSYPDAIVKGLEWCNCLVLIYSKNVLDSVDIPNELEVVHADRKKIIPFLIDDSKIEGGYRYYLPRQQWVNAYGCEFTKAIERLVVELHND